MQQAPHINDWIVNDHRDTGPKRIRHERAVWFFRDLTIGNPDDHSVHRSLPAPGCASIAGSSLAFLCMFVNLVSSYRGPIVHIGPFTVLSPARTNFVCLRSNASPSSKAFVDLELAPPERKQ